MKIKITLEPDSYKYPTKEERKKIVKFMPRINLLEIKYKSATIKILQHSNFENAVRDEDIYWWNNCLNNRFGKLTETYIYLNTHFLRLQESTTLESINMHTDKILLNYYIEIFYYYFFSSRDVLGQFINVIYDLKIPEDKIFLNEKFVEKIKLKKIKDSLSVFINNTKDSYNIRNSFNHRFTPTHQDLRAKRNIVKEGTMISFYSAEEIVIEMFIEDIENLMKQFSSLMSVISKEISKNTGQQT